MFCFSFISDVFQSYFTMCDGLKNLKYVADVASDTSGHTRVTSLIGGDYKRLFQVVLRQSFSHCHLSSALSWIDSCLTVFDFSIASTAVSGFAGHIQKITEERQNSSSSNDDKNNSTATTGRNFSPSFWALSFLADRTNSRAYATVLRLSSVCTERIVAQRCVLEQTLLLWCSG